MMWSDLNRAIAWILDKSWRSECTSTDFFMFYQRIWHSLCQTSFKRAKHWLQASVLIEALYLRWRVSSKPMRSEVRVARAAVSSSHRFVWRSAFKYLIGCRYREHSDMTAKSSGALWLAAEVERGGLRLEAELSEGFVSCLVVLDQSSGKITALFIKAHLTEEGHLCQPVLTPSPHLIGS